MRFYKDEYTPSRRSWGSRDLRRASAAVQKIAAWETNNESKKRGLIQCADETLAPNARCLTTTGTHGESCDAKEHDIPLHIGGRLRDIHVGIRGRRYFLRRKFVFLLPKRASRSCRHRRKARGTPPGCANTGVGGRHQLTRGQ